MLKLSKRKELDISFFKTIKSKNRSKKWLKAGLISASIFVSIQGALFYSSYDKLLNANEMMDKYIEDSYKIYDNKNLISTYPIKTDKEYGYDYDDKNKYNKQINSEESYNLYLNLMTRRSVPLGLSYAYTLLESPYISKETKEKILSSYKILTKNAAEKGYLDFKSTIYCSAVNFGCQIYKYAYKNEIKESRKKMAEVYLRHMYKIENFKETKEYSTVSYEYNRFKNPQKTEKNKLIIDNYQKAKEDYINKNSDTFISN